ncbi:MAG: hypothetical protein AAF999_06105 [Pseudomonadota bacterium]
MKTTIPQSASLIAAAIFAVALSSASEAQAQSGLFGSQEVKRWDMCDWRKIPDGVLARIERRSDYEDILRRMFNSCPDAALALTDRPTASTSDRDMRDDQRGRERDGDGPSEGPGNDGPAGDGPGGEGPGNDGPPNGGPPSDNPPPTA